MALPTLSAMWNEYPIGPKEAVGTLIGGDVAANISANDWDTCAIRMSRALNYGGSPVEGFEGMRNQYVPSKVRAIHGADKKWYIYSVYDMRVYLTNRFGQPAKYPSSTSSAAMATKGMSGVIMFFPEHVDLWNGTTIRYNDQLWGRSDVQELVFWVSPTESPK
jgi:hypothetical protein